MGDSIYFITSQSDVADGPVRFYRFGPAGLDAALPTGLPFLVYEDRHRSVLDYRRDSGECAVTHVGHHAVAFGRRAGRRWKSLFLGFHHDRLLCGYRL